MHVPFEEGECTGWEQVKIGGQPRGIGRRRPVSNLNLTRESALPTALCLLLVFAVTVVPSFADGQIYISGIAEPSAYPYSSVHIYGGGAMPNTTVVALLGGPVNGTFVVGNGTSPWIVVGASNLTLGSTFAGESGDWEINFLTPNVYPGYYNVYVFDYGSLTSDAVSFQVLMNVIGVPGLNVTLSPMNITIWSSNMTDLPPGPLLLFFAGAAVPSSGPPGTFVIMSGSFASGGEIDAYFDDYRVATVVGQHGDWSVSFQVPNVPNGNHTIRAIDAGGRWMSTAPFSVTSLELSIFSPSWLLLFGLVVAGVFSGTMMLLLLDMLRRKRK